MAPNTLITVENFKPKGRRTAAPVLTELCSLVAVVNGQPAERVMKTKAGAAIAELTTETYTHADIERRVLACGTAWCNAHCELDLLADGTLSVVAIVPSGRGMGACNK